MTRMMVASGAGLSSLHMDRVTALPFKGMAMERIRYLQGGLRLEEMSGLFRMQPCQRNGLRFTIGGRKGRYPFP